MAGRPQRTCLGCGARRDKSALLRLVQREGRLIIDRAQVLPGRGGYCCPRPECAARLKRLKEDRLRRVFRSEQRLSLEGLEIEGLETIEEPAEES